MIDIAPATISGISDEIHKLLLKQALGEMGMKYLAPQTRAEKLNEEMMRLAIIKSRRELDYDTDDYEADLNDNGVDRTTKGILMSEGSGFLRRMPERRQAAGLVPRFLEATAAPIKETPNVARIPRILARIIAHR